MTNPYEKKTSSRSFRKKDDNLPTDDVPLEVEQRLRSQLESFRHQLDPKDARVVNHTDDSGRFLRAKGKNSVSVARFAEIIGLISVVGLGIGLIIWAVI